MSRIDSGFSGLPYFGPEILGGVQKSLRFGLLLRHPGPLQDVPRGCPEMTPVWPYFEASGAFAGSVCPEMTPVWPNSAPADPVLGLRFQEVSKNDSGLAFF